MGGLGITKSDDSQLGRRIGRYARMALGDPEASGLGTAAYRLLRAFACMGITAGRLLLFPSHHEHPFEDRDSTTTDD